MGLLYDATPQAIASLRQYGSTYRNDHSAKQAIDALMSGAKLERTTDEYRIFSSANQKYQLYVALNEQRVELLTLYAPAFITSYSVTKHAVERYRERFGGDLDDKRIEQKLCDLLKSATLQTVGSNAAGVVHHYNSLTGNMRIVISVDERTIITVYPIKNEQLPPPTSPIMQTIITATRRELDKAQRHFRKRNRELTEIIANKQIELAQAAIRRANAKGQHIVNAVERRMAKIEAERAAYSDLLKEERQRFEQLREDAGKIIGA